MPRMEKTEWWIGDMKTAVKEKKVGWHLRLRNRSETNCIVIKRKRVKLLVRETKQRAWVTFGMGLETADHHGDQTFLAIIKNIRNGSKKQSVFSTSQVT